MMGDLGLSQASNIGGAPWPDATWIIWDVGATDSLRLMWSFRDRGIDKGIMLMVGESEDTLRGRATTYGDMPAIPELLPRTATATVVPVSCENVRFVEPVIDSVLPWFKDLNGSGTDQHLVFPPDPLVGRCFMPVVGRLRSTPDPDPELGAALIRELLPEVFRLDSASDPLSADPRDRRIMPDYSGTRSIEFRASWFRWNHDGQDSLRLIWRRRYSLAVLIVGASGDTLNGRAVQPEYSQLPPREDLRAEAKLVPVSCSELKLTDPPVLNRPSARQRDTTIR
jgi:hypothetical protein